MMYLIYHHIILISLLIDHWVSSGLFYYINQHPFYLKASLYWVFYHKFRETRRESNKENWEAGRARGEQKSWVSRSNVHSLVDRAYHLPGTVLSWGERQKMSQTISLLLWNLHSSWEWETGRGTATILDSDKNFKENNTGLCGMEEATAFVGAPGEAFSTEVTFDLWSIMVFNLIPFEDICILFGKSQAALVYNRIIWRPWQTYRGLCFILFQWVWAPVFVLSSPGDSNLLKVWELLS